MATLYVTEYSSLGLQSSGPAQAALEPENASQTVAIGGASAQSNAFGAATGVVRLHSDAICSVKFGTNPTAAATNRRMAANQTEYFAVPIGQSFKVAVITNS